MSVDDSIACEVEPDFGIKFNLSELACSDHMIASKQTPANV